MSFSGSAVWYVSGLEFNKYSASVNAVINFLCVMYALPKIASMAPFSSLDHNFQTHYQNEVHLVG